MGCDIHMFSERLPYKPAEECELLEWSNADLFMINKFYVEADEERADENKFDIVEILGDRNYLLFSLLADVRNSFDITPLSEPKGIPSDCSRFIEEKKEYWDSDGHSHSWFTLHELKEHRKHMIDNPELIHHSGYMTPANAELVDKGEMPNSWWVWGNMKDQVYREWTEKKDILKNLVTEMESRKSNIFKYDMRSEEEKDKEYRIVFWFDN